MIKYMTGDYNKPIMMVIVERETESSVWVNGRRKAKKGDWHNYHHSWEEAREYLIKKARMHESACQGRLDSAKIKLNRISRLSKRECE